MKIREAIAECDAISINTIDDNIKIKWLSRLDSDITVNILDAVNNTHTEFVPYTNKDAVLILPHTWEEMYVHYLSAQVNFYLGNIDKYNNEMAKVNELKTDYMRFVARGGLNDIQ